MRLTEQDRSRQLAHAREAIALCDCIATPEELAAAQELLQRDPMQPQAELKLSSHE